MKHDPHFDGTIFILLVLMSLILIFCGGCGAAPIPSDLRGESPTATGYVDPTLDFARVHLMDELAVRGVDTSHRPRVRTLSYVPMDPILLGTCDMLNIDVSISNRLVDDPPTTRAVVDHELMHCIFGFAAHDPEDGHIFSADLAPPVVDDWSDTTWAAELDRLANRIRDSPGGSP